MIRDTVGLYVISSKNTNAVHDSRLTKIGNSNYNTIELSMFSADTGLWDEGNELSKTIRIDQNILNPPSL